MNSCTLGKESMTVKKMNQLPLSEQPYHICWEKGANYLTDAQLLGVLLKSGTKDMAVVELATQIIGSKENSLLSLAKMSRKEMLAIKGIGKVKAMQLECMVELSVRLNNLRMKNGICLREPELIFARFSQRLRFLKTEHLYGIYLDGKGMLLKEELLTVGTMNSSLISPREIYRKALENEALYLILVHNHPSGSPQPSNADVKVTEIVKKAGEMLEIPLLDHIIVGDNTYISMRECDLL